MKNIKSFVLISLLFTSQNYTIDVRKNVNWCGDKLSAYGHGLMTDTTTQFATVTSVAATAVAYKYYQYNASLACLDGHPNGKIMYKANLIYMSYPDFLDTIQATNSYGATLDFINNYCTSFGAVSDSKINSFIALINDLQKNNGKRIDTQAEQENIVLENFKNNLFIAKENLREELINGAINAHKNAHNMYTLNAGLDLMCKIYEIFFK